MSENHKIFFDSDGKPVARLSSNMLEFKHADLPELEAFFKGKLPQKPSTPTAKEMDTIEKAAAEAAIKDSKNNEAGQAQNEESEHEKNS